jgi:hypothetical protein
MSRAWPDPVPPPIPAFSYDADDVPTYGPEDTEDLGYVSTNITDAHEKWIKGRGGQNRIIHGSTVRRSR